MSTKRHTLIRVVIAFLIIAGVFFRWNQFIPETTRISHIGDERASCPVELIEEAKIDGEKLKRYLGDLDITVAFYGRMAMLAYYSELPAIECATGLTDEYIAHLPLLQRAVPGHEKRIPYEYLQHIKVNFVLGKTYYNEIREISFDGTICHIVAYDNKIMDVLRQYPEVKFVYFPTVLDEYMEVIESVPKDRLQSDFRIFEEYYFNYNNDPERLAVFRKWLDG